MFITSQKLMQTLCFALLLFTFCACGGGSSNTPVDQDTTDSSNTTQVETAEEKKEEAPPAPKLDLSNPVVEIMSGKSTMLECEGKEMDLMPMIKHYADSITALWKAKKIVYNSDTKDDCSGTFIKLNQYLNTFCGPADFPKFGKAIPGQEGALRDTRSLVKYYHAIGDLIFIKDPLTSDSLIKEGAVMFYTFGATPLDIDITPENMAEHVNHVGVVTKVIPGAEHVENYELFHGRSPNSGINITNFHQRAPRSNPTRPYGNGKERWMAVAPVVKRG